MVSETKCAANRENAKRSTGPKSDEGRRRSAMNAVRHGFCAKTVCVHGEEAEHFNALVTQFVREHRPASSTEYALVYRMAVASWNLRRVTEAETAMIDAATFHRTFESGKWVERRVPVGEAMLKVMKDDKRFNTLQIYQQRLERAFYRALSELRRVRKERMERDDDEETVETIWFAGIEASDVEHSCSRELARDGDDKREQARGYTGEAQVAATVEERQNEQTNPAPPQGKASQAVTPPVQETWRPYVHVDERKLLSPAEKRFCNEDLRRRGLALIPMDKRVMTDGTILED